MTQEVEANKEVLPKWRTIELSTDGNNIKIVKAEVAGRLEMIAILKEILKNYEK